MDLHLDYIEGIQPLVGRKWPSGCREWKKLAENINHPPSSWPLSLVPTTPPETPFGETHSHHYFCLSYLIGIQCLFGWKWLCGCPEGQKSANNNRSTLVTAQPLIWLQQHLYKGFLDQIEQIFTFILIVLKLLTTYLAAIAFLAPTKED